MTQFPYKKYLFCIVLGIISISCNHRVKETKLAESIESASDSITFGERVALGSIEKKSLDEISGIAMSIENENSFWIHNDNGGKSKIFLINNEAKLVSSCKLNDIENRDWEDIAVYKDHISGSNKIAIGDIGDNDAEHNDNYIYLLDEPKITNEEEITINNIDKISYRYEDGKRDAETLMVDPINGDIIILSKREKNINVYQVQYPYSFTDLNTAKKLLTLPYTQIVGGDISSDGTKIIIKNYANVWFWSRQKGQSIADAMSKRAVEVPYIREPQGEAICWARDGKSFYTLSEESPLKIKPVLYRYEIK